MLRTILAALAVFSFASAARAQAPTRAVLPMQALTHDGVQRQFGLYAPASLAPDPPAPLILVLHGRFSSAQAMHGLSHLQRVADARGALLVYPETVGGFWSDGGHAALGRREAQQDDAGFSNGGFMTLRMTCSASDMFAGFAEVASALYIEMNNVCRSSRPAPLLLMHGTGDDAVRYEGVTIPNPQGGEPLRITLSVMETVSFFVRRNNCSFAGQQTQYAESGRSPGTHVVRFEPRDCAAPLSFYLINGGGHTWPGEEQLPVESFGPTNMDIRASEVIWDFLSRQTLPDAPR